MQASKPRPLPADLHAFVIPRKKVLLIACIVLIAGGSCLLLLLLPVNNYVSPTIGDEFEWDISFSTTTLNELANDLNDSSVKQWFPHHMRSDIRVKITGIDYEKGFTAYNYYSNKTLEGVLGKEIHFEFYNTSSRTATNAHWTRITNVNSFTVYEGSTLIYATTLTFGNLIVANNINFPTIASVLSVYLEMRGENATVIAGDHSLAVTYKAYGKFEKTEIESSYTPDGILESFSYEYGGSRLFRVTLAKNSLQLRHTTIITIVIIIYIIGAAFIVNTMVNKKVQPGEEGKVGSLQRIQFVSGSVHHTPPTKQMSNQTFYEGFSAGMSVVKGDETCSFPPDTGIEAINSPPQESWNTLVDVHSSQRSTNFLRLLTIILIMVFLLMLFFPLFHKVF